MMLIILIPNTEYSGLKGVSQMMFQTQQLPIPQA